MITRGCCTRPNKKDQSYLAKRLNRSVKSRQCAACLGTLFQAFQLTLLPHIAAHGNDFAVVIVLFQLRDDNRCVQTAGICQHDLFDFRHRNCLRSNQLIYFSISLVQFHDCSVHCTGTWKMCKKCSVYSSNMKAVFHSWAL